MDEYATEGMELTPSASSVKHLSHPHESAKQFDDDALLDAHYQQL